MRTATGLSSVIHVIRQAADCTLRYRFANSASGQFELEVWALFHFPSDEGVLDWDAPSGDTNQFSLTRS
jgi:hypothetical protein